ncbi:hypothetical protein P168DRAFT_324356 [Aspergillus campestris IBT 28561]|uniref:Zn(2)-C6 fungal-type domain-containing protein n=1 Tax=Aspergillus campestris (strain IBT 28561) TaxID=1392248 RepID=A0A2I1DHP2_ASPC2|nr:uncharacterized protein P168DRAFT_324356 [Aspergillus campestris IBT 28561]PKY09391.1 hypothetical protein P168DRAFT_324356 [Aspergillus campestris IBT 28561]
MPGVPSGRGCEACRKQKKKCDQAQPSCARCARLNIPCVGGGVRRFKFMDQGVVVKMAVNRKTDPQPQTRAPTPRFLPSSETNAIANAFVCMMEVTDVRYDISCYGGFLKQVPSRLGTSPVLDASVTALTHASAALYTRQDHVEVFQKYGHGLSVLRTALSNAHESHSADTLCAIYFLMIAEGWIMRKYDICAGHVSGMAYVLNILAAKKDPDPFEQDLLRTLCLPVLLVSILDPTVKLPTSVMRQITVAGPRRPILNNENAPIRSLQVTTFAKYPDLVHHPELHFSDLVATYQQMHLEYAILRRRLDTTTVDIAAEANRVPNLKTMRLQALFQVGCSLVLTLAIILNRVYHTCDPLEPGLDDDLNHFCRESFTLAEAALPHRPLGSSPIPLNLTIAWAVVRDAHLREQIEGMIEVYEASYIKTPWKASAFLLQQHLTQLRLRMASLRQSEDIFRTVTNSSFATPS